jgi:cobalamin biosynthesis protein CobW
MTKKDLVDETKYEEVKAIIAGTVRPDVKMVAAANGVLSADILLGVNAAAEDDLESRHSHHEEDHANGLEHHHDDDIDSVVVDITAPHTPETLVEALKELIEEHEIYRIKGFIDIPGKPMRMVLQGVSNRFDHYFDRKWKDSETRKTSLVIIGDELHDKDLATIINERLTVVS